MKLVDVDRRLRLFGQLRDGLTDVTIIADHLSDGAFQPQQRAAVHGPAVTDRVGSVRLAAQHRDELIAEQRHTVR